MKSLWKVVLALALVIPMGAYVAGSLVASAADDPAPRPPVVIKDSGRSASPDDGRSSPSSSPTPSATSTTEVGEIEFDPDDLDDHGDDSGRDDDLAHDAGDDHGGDRGGDDHSGPGGDDHSGPGRGDDGGHGSDDGGGGDD